MDRIDKFLSKLHPRDRFVILAAIKQIGNGDLSGLNIKKLKGQEGRFRARVGRHRIIFENKNGEISFLKVSKRDDTTY